MLIEPQSRVAVPALAGFDWSIGLRSNRSLGLNLLCEALSRILEATNAFVPASLLETWAQTSSGMVRSSASTSKGFRNAGCPVPDLTRSARINLNKRLLLQLSANPFYGGDVGHCRSSETSVAKVRRAITYSARRLRLWGGPHQMKAAWQRRPFNDQHSAKPAGAEFWHLWTVRIPRRSITGEFVWGRVLRCHDGRRWVYARVGSFPPCQTR